MNNDLPVHKIVENYLLKLPFFDIKNSFIYCSSEDFQQKYQVIFNRQFIGWVFFFNFQLHKNKERKIKRISIIVGIPSKCGRILISTKTNVANMC